MKPIAESRQTKICILVSFKNSLKQGGVLLPLVFNFTLECTIRRVQADKECLKLIGTHQPLFYDDLNVQVPNIHTIKKNTEALLFVTNEIGLELSDKKAKYLVMS